jgi:hypothetical protein
MNAPAGSPFNGEALKADRGCDCRNIPNAVNDSTSGIAVGLSVTRSVICDDSRAKGSGQFVELVLNLAGRE